MQNNLPFIRNICQDFLSLKLLAEYKASRKLSWQWWIHLGSLGLDPAIR